MNRRTDPALLWWILLWSGFFWMCSPLDPLARNETAERYVVVERGAHPSLLFAEKELPRLRRQAAAGGLAGEAWQRVVRLARGDSNVRYEGDSEAHRLTAQALVYQITRDEVMGRAALDHFQAVLRQYEPISFYERVGSDFFETEHWPKAFAYAWDWLYEFMSEEERNEILPQLENWCAALYAHTDAWWWRDASYNCGAIPVGALGLLCLSIQGETSHPDFEKWLNSCVHRIRDNYFPTAWRANGICYEGPCYAQYHKNPTQFAEALRRTGGPDLVQTSGAVNGMHYQVFQWMPQGGCGPIGDNTDYGRRVFAAAYLLGIGELNDHSALWTFERFTDRSRLDPILTFLWYPEKLSPVSPGTAEWPTSYYFEITPNRAGYVYSRSEWDNDQAHYFAFVTRFSGANHQHYDMNSFLFHAFGEEFGTHRNLFTYSNPNHGADLEHNLVIVDGGGWPANDRQSAGDDCSTNGLLVGLGLGHLADYVRGDAKDSYRDNSVPGSCPALRADRTCLFVKQGANPYILVVDDIQQSQKRHDYDWQWYTEAGAIAGEGSMERPLRLRGEAADCQIVFLEPRDSKVSYEWVEGGHSRRKVRLGLIKLRQRGSRVRYAALASAWKKGAGPPSVRPGPEVHGNRRALSVVVEGQGYSDLIVWQPEEVPEEPPSRISCGGLELQGLLGMVRRGPEGEVTGFLLGEGGLLGFQGEILVRSGGTVSVSADPFRTWVTGKLETRKGDAPVPASASVRALSSQTQFYVDGERVELSGPAEEFLTVKHRFGR